MAVASGTRLGPYEILAPIGAGGMGEVYRARDIKLDRDVAIKVLPPALAQDPERLARFEREAKVLAALNHPNIAAIYGLQDWAIVMELVEGPTLADRIKSGPLRLEEALTIARQVAEALEAAHEKGVVHRDLKPANIKITPEGTVKVLDFGLATAVQGADRDSVDAANSPTLTMGATEVGVILGTAAYMSPEQASGKRVDRRADIWSFGVVLWEMLTGKQLFSGETISHTLADVLRAPIEFEKLPVATPPQIRELLKRCLDRDAKTRLRDIGEARVAIAKYLANPANGTEVAPRIKSRTAQWAWPAVAAVMTLAATVLAFVHFREQPPEQQVLRYTLAAPEKTSIMQFAVSPNGHYLVIATSPKGLLVRSLDSLQTQPLAGTEGAIRPFWSPDSRYIGFFAEGKLKKIAVSGGPAQTLCDAANGQGGTWNQDGVILFTSSTAGGLSRVAAAGGVPATVTEASDGKFQFLPVFLPDGHRFLFAEFGKESGIHLGSLESKEIRRLHGDQSLPAYFNGHLLFVRDRTLMAEPVDPNTLEPKGDLFPVAEQVSPGTQNPSEYLYSISNNGVLVYRTGGASGGRQHLWFDRVGKELEAVGGAVLSRNSFVLSPDEKRVVIERLAGGTNSELWISDLEHGTESRFTFDASANLHPVWSPDGSKIAFASNRGSGVFNLYQRASNGAGQDELLYQSKDGKRPSDWSHDGRFLIYWAQDPKTRNDLWALPVTGEKTGERKPVPLLTSEFDETEGQLSPDDRWLAYTSNESGAPEVYVMPFTPGSSKPMTGKWQVSTGGGTQPRWRGDGRELFYMAPDNKLMSVAVKTTAESFDRSTPQSLFDSRSLTLANQANWSYVPSANGKRFLIVTAAGEREEQPPLTVVVNWLALNK